MSEWCRKGGEGKGVELGCLEGGRILPKDMCITVDFGGPFRLAAVAFALVGGHDYY